MDKKQQVIFIASASRSGSTLLDRLLGTLPGTISLGEVHQIWRRGFLENHSCGCGEPFLACAFWTKVRSSCLYQGESSVRRILELQRRVVRNRLVPAMIHPGFANPSLQRDSAIYGKTLLELYSAVAAVSGNPIVVDSSKRAAHGMLLARRDDISLTVIHLVRDSRAVAFSSARVKRKLDAQNPEALMARLTAWQSSTGWNRQNMLAALLRAKVKRSILLKYEDLMRDPQAAVRQICAVSGLGHPDLSHIQRTEAVLPTAHSVSGNPMRMLQGRVSLHADEEWRTAMPAYEQRLVTLRTGPLLLRYGYPLSV